MAVAAEVEKKPSARGKDLRKQEFEWNSSSTLYEVPTGSFKGARIVDMDDPEDLAQLGQIQGHCAGTHWRLVCEERLWKFLVLVEANGYPSVTMHAKKINVTGKLKGTEVPLPADVKLAIKRKGYYTTLPELKEAFKTCGKEYEPHKYALDFDFHAYGSPGGARDEHPREHIKRDLGRYEREVARQLDRAKAYGPLGKDNPAKAYVDAARRELNTQKQRLKDMDTKLYPLGWVCPYSTIEVGDEGAFGPLSYAIKGQNENYDHNKYTAPYVMWMQEKGVVR